MKAVHYRRYGGGAAGLEHVEVSIPTPRKDEILIKLEAVSINPIDWKMQKGIFKPFVPNKFPFTPVSDVAGKVASVGRNVEGFKEGDNVVTVLPTRNGGGLAEYAIASSNMTVKNPTEIPAAEVSGLGIAGLTALKSLELIGAKFDGTGTPSNILITAASGGVGHYAVQLARLANFHITATCGARNLELVKNLGADEVLDYKTPQGETLASPSGKKYDAVIHCGSSLPWSKFDPIISNNGKVIDVTPTVSSIFTYSLKKLSFSKKQLLPFLLIPKFKDLQVMVNLLQDGKIKTLVDSKFPLALAKEAWLKSMDGHATGKVIVEMINQNDK